MERRADSHATLSATTAPPHSPVGFGQGPSLSHTNHSMISRTLGFNQSAPLPTPAVFEKHTPTECGQPEGLGPASALLREWAQARGVK